ncbi:hypothetical protein NQ317_013105 [Molorchus minor]|uniref:Uncharacterized protein n=1 Tax=Molorchus minor TaxID=1323400 RepID=A0ABQ9JWC3_9CUCU|nr:hypothetical protein NQ317_013105 [Molorchus minor]
MMLLKKVNVLELIEIWEMQVQILCVYNLHLILSGGDGRKRQAVISVVWRYASVIKAVFLLREDWKHADWVHEIDNYTNSGELSKVKVIDMTGPQQRVLSGYHALSGLKAPPGVEHFEDVVHKKCSNFALPEIQHNLDLIDIIRIDRNTRYNEDRILALEQEEKSFERINKE